MIIKAVVMDLTVEAETWLAIHFSKDEVLCMPAVS